MRPRDLLIETFRMVCRHYGVVRILAVPDEGRVHRSTYSRARMNDPVAMSYNAVWCDRGGTMSEDGFFDLPIVAQQRDRESIRQNKRAEYRRRYAMLDEIQTAIGLALGSGAADKN
ncbi:MAG: DUF535 family protein [Sphingomonadales bacterium]